MRSILGALAATLLAGSAAADPSVVPLDMQAPPWVAAVGGDERLHLLYELRLTNFAARPVTLETLEVLDASGVALGTFDAAALRGMVAHRGSTPAKGAELSVPAGGFVIVFVGLQAPAGEPPTRLSHRVRVSADSPTAPASRRIVQGGETPVAASPLVLGPPLKGSGWLAANALSNDSDHRRTIAVVDGKARISQRYAVDFVRLDSAGRPFRGDPAANPSWSGYGAEVLAVADGTVVATRDDIPDNAPGSAPSTPVSLATIGGNHVVLDLGGGAFAFYGHLQPGGVRVKAGQKVRRGEVLGLLGNSGQSDAPHLHFHVSDGQSALGGEGLPYVFERLAVRGHVPGLEVLERPDGWSGMGAGRSRQAQAELPTANAVVDFAP